ncbi:MAG: alpha/beta fold hydrolase [Chloroflexaceae bacterium]|jgi:pimeloyl-ACP methyl ester carboxylesterase|nr:alpha/beta fold hydrolase [Chloroflexaceae bacterium]
MSTQTNWNDHGLAEHVVFIANGRIRYFTAGAGGTPVVLLHGGGTDSAQLSWRLTIPSLAQTQRVFAPDWPGYGRSEPMQGPYTTTALITILRQLLDEWQLPQASLVGISMGGGVALGFALAFPERVSRLVLVGSYGLQERAPVHWLSYLFLQLPVVNRLSWASLRRSRRLTMLAVQRIFHNPALVSSELVDEVFAAIRHSQAETSFYAWQRDEVGRYGLKSVYVDRLRELTVPTLVLHGAHDSLVPLACARRAATLIPNARLEVLSDCGHWPQREKPAIFNQIVRAFLG